MAQWNTNHDYQQYSAYDTFTQSFDQPLNQPFLSHENGVLPLDSTSSLPSGFGYAQNALPTGPRQAQIPPTGVYPSVGNGLFGYDQPIPNLYPEQGMCHITQTYPEFIWKCLCALHEGKLTQRRSHIDNWSNRGSVWTHQINLVGSC